MKGERSFVLLGKCDSRVECEAGERGQWERYSGARYSTVVVRLPLAAITPAICN